jgi:TonB family protein
LRRFFTDNINSILGAIILHLMVVIAFLWFKLGEVGEKQKEQVLIEFNEEIKPLEDKTQVNKKTSEGFGDEMPVLDKQTLHNIASNVSSKLDPEISTSNYEKEVLKELGISTLKSPGGDIEKEANQAPDENSIGQTSKTDASRSDLDAPNVLRKDNTTVSYFLEGRWHRYIYIPTYKCQGGGTVIMNLVIDQAGKVASAIISENKSTGDPCLREEAYRSASTAQFNPDLKAPAKQLGTITYVFLAQ